MHNAKLWKFEIYSVVKKFKDVDSTKEKRISHSNFSTISLLDNKKVDILTSISLLGRYSPVSNDPKTSTYKAIVAA